jgi:hypothetical protein
MTVHSVRHAIEAVVCTLAIVVPFAALPPAVTAGTTAPSSLFATATSYPITSHANAVAIGDVTGDGRPDVLATTGFANSPATDFRLAVFAQKASGTLAAPVLYPVSNAAYWPTSIAVGDVTGDGRNDVVVGVQGLGIDVFPGLADGTLGMSTRIATADNMLVSLGHFGGGGALDLVGVGWGTDTATVFRNDGFGHFGTGTVYAAPHGGYDDLAVGDVTGDGLDDIVVMSGQLYADPNIDVLPQLAGGGFGAVASYRVGNSILTHGVGIGDVTGDGRSDVVASYGGNSPSSSIAVFAQDGQGGITSPPMSLTSFDLPTPVAVADVDLDGRPDVVVGHTAWNAVGVYLGQADGSLSAETLFTVGFTNFNPRSMAVGDVTGDGWPDVVLGDSNTGVMVVPSTGAAITAPGAPTLTSAASGDGQVALAWTAPTTGSPAASYTATASPGGASCSTSGLACTVSGLANGTSYTFTVRASNSAGTGPASNVVTATPATVPSPPTGLKASASKTIGLSWKAPATNGGLTITAYTVYRGTASGAETVLVTVPASSTSYVDVTTARKTTYFYRVAAVNGVGEGAPSSEVSAKTK